MPINLSWLDSQQNAMTGLLTRLANLNSGSNNLPGLLQVAAEIEEAFTPLRPDIAERIPLPPAEHLTPDARITHQPLAPLLRFAKRPTAPTKVLLVIHY